MATGDFQPIQKQLIRCQELLDEARMNGWSDEQKEHLLEASRNLHELAVLWAQFKVQPFDRIRQTLASLPSPSCSRRVSDA